MRETWECPDSGPAGAGETSGVFDVVGAGLAGRSARDFSVAMVARPHVNQKRVDSIQP